MLFEPHDVPLAGATISAVEQLFFDVFWSFVASFGAVGAVLIARAVK